MDRLVQNKNMQKENMKNNAIDIKGRSNQHLYKLIYIKNTTTMQRNKQNNTHISQTTKNDGKNDKSKTHSEKHR